MTLKPTKKCTIITREQIMTNIGGHGNMLKNKLARYVYLVCLYLLPIPASGLFMHIEIYAGTSFWSSVFQQMFLPLSVPLLLFYLPIWHVAKNHGINVLIIPLVMVLFYILLSVTPLFYFALGGIIIAAIYSAGFLYYFNVFSKQFPEE